MPTPPNIAKGSTGSALGGWTEAVSIASGLIVNYAFASSIKSDQKRFEKEIAKLDAKKQEELLKKVQQAETEIERQKIVYQYVDKQKIDELKKEGKKQRTILYFGLGAGVLIYALLLLKLKKHE